MKKLMIVAVVALAAVCTQAASLKWGGNKIQKVEGGGTASNYTALFFISADSTGTAPIDSKASVISAIETGSYKVADALGYKTVSGGLISSITETHSEWNGSGAATPDGATVTAFAIIVDTKTIDKDGYLTGINNYLVLDEKTYTFSNAETYTMAWGDQSANKWNAVPEPTSGLLLLLGVAGLALRRRRA